MLIKGLIVPAIFMTAEMEAAEEAGEEVNELEGEIKNTIVYSISIISPYKIKDLEYCCVHSGDIHLLVCCSAQKMQGLWEKHLSNQSDDWITKMAANIKYR